MEQTFHRVITADARALAGMVAGPVDCVVTSPPYPMIEMWDELFCRCNPAIATALSGGDPDGAWEMMHRELDPVWTVLAGLVRPGGVVCINIGDATRSLGGEFRLFSNHSRILHRFLELGFVNLPNILWRKQTNAPNKFMGSGMLPSGAYVTLEHEHILIFRKGGRRLFRSEEEKQRRRASAFFWEERNSWFSDLWDFKGVSQTMGTPGGRARSGAFPFELAFRLVSMFSVQGDTVLDPFLGTGTTTLAAMASGRHSLGVELDAALAARLLATTGAATADALNAYLRTRLERHAAFVQQRTELRFRHRNAHHGIAVMTQQEEGLAIRRVASVERCAPETVVVQYAEPIA